MQVDPRYIEYPFWRLVSEFGYDWINQQDKIFKETHKDTVDIENGCVDILA